MRPDKHTPGNIGDIITDESTGKKYKLVSIYFMDVDGDLNDEKTFEWDELPDEGGSGESGGGHGGPCSWNDLTDKPFGEEVALEVVVPETSDTYIDEHVTTHGYYIPDNWINGGEIFVVTVDEVKYHCVAYEYTDYYGSVYIGIGDSRLELFLDENANEIPNINHPEDVPFFVRYSCEDSDGTGITWIHGFAFYYPDEETHTIKIEKETGETKINPLDEKFIPESIARKDDIPESSGGVSSWNDLTDKPFYEEVDETIDILPEQRVSFEPTEIGEGKTVYAIYMSPAICSLVTGQTYHVAWNDVLFSCIAVETMFDGESCVAIGDSSIYEGNDTPNEPFFLLYHSVGDINIAYMTEDGSTNKVRIYQNSTIVKTLDPKFLPKDDIVKMIDEYIATALGGDY